MIAEMRGAVPGYSALLARTHIQNAWSDVRNMKGWSFQLGNGGFGTPPLVNAGSVTVAFGGNHSDRRRGGEAAWATTSQPGSLLTQRQFRGPGNGQIYNIIGYTVTGGFGVLTLDRPYYDTTSGSTLGYSLYQCYYPVPVADFLAWESVLDVNNAIDLVTGTAKKNRDWVDANDPQRQIFSNPGSIIPYGTDQRTGSSTAGWMIYELYPQPQAQYSYQTWYSRKGADLVLPSDTLPFPITEHVIKTLARVKAYEWLIVKLQAEHPDRNVSGIQFAMGAAAKEAAAQLKEIRMEDRDRVDMWYSVMNRVKGYGVVTTFNPNTGMVIGNNTNDERPHEKHGELDEQDVDTESDSPHEGQAHCRQVRQGHIEEDCGRETGRWRSQEGSRRLRKT